MPQKLRGALAAQLGQHAAPAIAEPAPPFQLPLGIIGLFRSTSGIGQTARCVADALEQAGTGCVRIDVSTALGHADALPPLQDKEVPEGASLLVCLNAPAHLLALAHLGAQIIRNRRIIGYWVWDLPRLPESWHAALPFVHEIWVPTRFVADAVRKSTDKPVHVIPYPVAAAPEVPRAQILALRERLEIPPHAVLSLQIFSMDSNLTRKNPHAALQAFRQAFAGDPRQHLLFKVRKPELFADAFQLFAAACAEIPNVHLLTDPLHEADMQALVQAADIIVNLHRAEGFGLPLAEAMLAGKPVLTTDYSGPKDFLTPDGAALVPCWQVPVDDPLGSYNLPGTSWAEADIEAAAALWRQLGQDTELRAQLGAAAKAHITKLLSPQNFVAKIKEATQQRI